MLYKNTSKLLNVSLNISYKVDYTEEIQLSTEQKS